MSDSSSSGTCPDIHDVPEESRYEARIDDELAGVAAYDLHDDGVVEITHTVVEDRFEGRGIGSALTRAALEQIRADNGRVIPTCPFVATYVEQHPEYANLVATSG